VKIGTRFIVIFAGICMALLNPLTAQSPDDAIGFWKTIDEKEGFTTSIMAVYKYHEKLYGRIIVSFDEKTGELLETHRAPSQQITTIPRQPKLLEVDLFWEVERKGDRWKGGRILDPRSGRTFACDCWVHDSKLIIRGKVGPFGLNSVFYPVDGNDFPKGYIPPDLNEIIPNKP
jgi:uncharacterized protein (DUF2147 family)